MGTATFVVQTQDVEKNTRVVRGVLTFSSAYATGGDTLNMTTCGLTRVVRVRSADHEDATKLAVTSGGTPTAFKVKAWAGAEIANGLDLSGSPQTVILYGS